MDSTPRQALVAYLATKFGPSGSLGKKAVQKYVHILSSLSRRSFGYDFSFYTYGPFSRDLASDLDLLAAAGNIHVSYNSGNNSYSITSTPESELLTDLLSQADRAAADRVWSNFSGRTAKQLELVSTILFIADEEDIAVLSPEMAERVRALKPKYVLSEIGHAQDEVAALR